MANPAIVYANKWGEVIDRPDEDCVEIRWYDTSADMSGDDFNGFLSSYAGHVERCGRGGGLVDAVQFKMDMRKMSTGWRDENIIPRYNAAGVQKFAFIMPAGMPAIGAAPAAEGPAQFPTGYFGSRKDALAWLNGA